MVRCTVVSRFLTQKRWKWHIIPLHLTNTANTDYILRNILLPSHIKPSVRKLAAISLPKSVNQFCFFSILSSCLCWRLSASIISVWLLFCIVSCTNKRFSSSDILSYIRSSNCLRINSRYPIAYRPKYSRILKRPSLSVRLSTAR